MRIISRRPIREFGEKHADAKEDLLSWYAEAKRARWKTPVQLLADYPNASFVGDRVVFNIRRNKYRLIVKINFSTQLIFVRFIGTHAEYDGVNVRTT